MRNMSAALCLRYAIWRAVVVVKMRDMLRYEVYVPYARADAKILCESARSVCASYCERRGVSGKSRESLRYATPPRAAQHTSLMARAACHAYAATFMIRGAPWRVVMRDVMSYWRDAVCARVVMLLARWRTMPSRFTPLRDTPMRHYALILTPSLRHHH